MYMETEKDMSERKEWLQNVSRDATEVVTNTKFSRTINVV